MGEKYGGDGTELSVKSLCVGMPVINPGMPDEQSTVWKPATAALSVEI